MYERESIPRLRRQGLRGFPVPSERIILNVIQRLLGHGQFTTPAHVLGAGRPRLAVEVTMMRDDLTTLKQGEETKSKTYEALCIKLENSKSAPVTKQNGCHTVQVTQADIDKINSFTNLLSGDEGKLSIVQKTPIRVLHRRPLLERKRMILELEAKLVPERPQLFTIRIKTSAGTYVKEWVHGELGRAKPSLGDAIDAPVDILALDVMEVHLDWPPVKAQ